MANKPYLGVRLIIGPTTKINWFLYKAEKSGSKVLELCV